LAVEGVVWFDEGSDRWIILQVFMTGDVSMLVAMHVCFASVVTWQGTAQQFPTAFRPDMRDLAKCHSGFLKLY
jgi:folate-binding Fe-S cluster repair protein YgfZ